MARAKPRRTVFCGGKSVTNESMVAFAKGINRMTTHKAKQDKRLLGTWRSDRRRTLRDWIWRKGFPASKRKRLADIFGHLTLRYTKRRLYSDYKGYKEMDNFEIVAADLTPSPS
jgi:hypothetical protein